MSDESDPPGDGSGNGESRSGDSDRHLDKREERLEQREMGLDHRAEELDEREATIRNQRERNEELDNELKARQERIEQREEDLDDREVGIQQRERELSERADELTQKEQTLEAYVGDQVAGLEDSISETVHGAVSTAMEGYDDGAGASRLGTIGSLLLGLVGIMLVAAGVAYGFGPQVDMIPELFASSTGNLIVTVLLLFSGLAANLAAVAD